MYSFYVGLLSIFLVDLCDLFCLYENSWVNVGHLGENPNIIMDLTVGQRQP